MKNPEKISQLWSNDHVERLFAGGGIGFIFVAPDQRILDANKTFCDKTGYSREELLAMSIPALTHPDDLDFTRGLFEIVHEDNVTRAVEKRYITRKGDVIWCKVRSEAVRDDAGRLLYRIVMAEDITKDKENEFNQEQMAAIVEASDDAIFRCNTGNIIEFWSKGAEQLYGYTSKEAIGRHANFIVAVPENSDVMEAPAKLARGEVVVVPDTFTRHKDGHFVEVSVVIFPIKNRDDKIIAYAAIHRDISKLKQLEEQLRHSQRMETAGLLAGGIAHDFNNILTVIQGSCNFIVQELEPASPISRHLELIERSAERASRLTRQLLAFSRKQQSAPEVLDPNPLLEDFATMLKRTLGDDISLETSFNSSWVIREDPTQLEQMVLNLSLNARHAMPKGGRIMIETGDIRITNADAIVSPGKLRFSPGPIAPGEYVALSITDTGIGMDKETLEHIFDPFYTTKAKGEGTGLGLSVVYGMVAQSGGSIRVITEAGHGTEFQILFPRIKGSPERQSTEESTARHVGKGSILVLEDNEDVRTLSATLLKSAGYTVTVAENPRQILNDEVDGNVDLILSDVIMPGMSGPEFSEIWLDKHPNANFLFMSGFFDENNTSEALNSNNLIQKPFKPSELLDRVNRILEQ